MTSQLSLPYYNHSPGKLRVRSIRTIFEKSAVRELEAPVLLAAMIMAMTPVAMVPFYIK
jgi:hypothetical protein